MHYWATMLKYYIALLKAERGTTMANNIFTRNGNGTKVSFRARIKTENAYTVERGEMFTEGNGNKVEKTLVERYGKGNIRVFKEPISYTININRETLINLIIEHKPEAIKFKDFDFDFEETET